MRVRVQGIQMLGTCLLVAIALLVLPEIANAGTYWDGANQYISDGVNGVSQNIEVSNPHVVSGGFSCAWCMVKCSQFDPNKAYAQVGWIKMPSFSSPHYFKEYCNTSGNWTRTTYGIPTVGSSHDFWLIGDQYHFDFDVDLTDLGTIDKSILSWGTQTQYPGDEAEYNAETQMAADTCAGSPSNHNAFLYANYQDFSGTGYPAGPTFWKNNSNFGFSWLGSPPLYQDFDVWDSRN